MTFSLKVNQGICTYMHLCRCLCVCVCVNMYVKRSVKTRGQPQLLFLDTIYLASFLFTLFHTDMDLGL